MESLFAELAQLVSAIVFLVGSLTQLANEDGKTERSHHFVVAHMLDRTDQLCAFMGFVHILHSDVY